MRIAMWSASLTTFLPRSKLRSSTWSPPAQPVETPSVAWFGSGEVGELKRVLRSILLEVGDHGLKLVELLAGHADLVVHDLGLHLEFELFDVLDDLAGVVRVDSRMELQGFADRIVR